MGAGPSGGGQKKTFGGFAQAFCIGPVKTLNHLRDGETILWSGPLDVSSRDGSGKSVLSTTLGPMNFYWGTATQTADPFLQAAMLDLGDGPETLPIPAWPYLCYITAQSVSFGQQDTPPVLKADLFLETSGLTLSQHNTQGHGIVPEIIWEWLTNRIYGAGIPEAAFDRTSFEATAETLISEAFGCSPTVDDNTTPREVIGKLLNYIDGVLVMQNGLITMKLIRQQSTSGVETVTAADMLEEPEPTNEGPEETWNITYATFQDQANNYESSSEPYADPANAANYDVRKPKVLDFPWCKVRHMAKMLAKLHGVRGGLVPMTWNLVLKPSWRTLVPGDRLFVDYPKLGIEDRLVRITTVETGTPDDPAVKLEVLEESTRDMSHDYVPPEDEFSLPIYSDDGGQSLKVLTSTLPRLSWLPPTLLSGSPDGAVIACQRPDSTTTGVKAYITYDPGTSPYQQILTSHKFPAKGTVVCWHRLRDSAGVVTTPETWFMRIKLDSQHDYDRLADLLTKLMPWDVYAVTGERLVKLIGTTQDEHQVTAPWGVLIPGGRQELVSDTLIDLEVGGGYFGSDDWALEEETDPSQCPTRHIYFGHKEDFLIWQSSGFKFAAAGGNGTFGSDPDEIRYLKATIQKGAQEQSVSDVDAATYDRDDTTMCPDGTYGAAADGSLEAVDISLDSRAHAASDAAYPGFHLIDEALYRVSRGTASVADHDLADHYDDVYGAMVEEFGVGYDDSVYVRAWGDRTPTTYEDIDVLGWPRAHGAASPADYTDVQDIDEALHAILIGTATTDQALLANHVDLVLGAMVESSLLRYNTA